MSRSLTDALVICTRNRESDLRRCLEYVARSSRLPDDVLIVDSSDDPTTAFRAVDGLAWPGDRAPRVLTTAPGLPRQRNVGVDSVDTDVVHFIDDDVVVEASYFERMLMVFAEDQRAVGACGYITNLQPRQAVGWGARLFLLDGREGSILRSGRNVLNFTPSAERRPTSWLSGCSMSYRRAALLEQRFDEALSGYALGEDVDLSSRVAHSGRLVFDPSARLAHLESPAMRWTPERVTRSELRFRHRRVLAGAGGERVLAFWWSVIGQALHDTARALTRRSRYSILHAKWTLQGAVDIVRQRGEW